MPTIPTGKLELELRRLYFRWLSHLGDEANMDKAVDRFEKQSIDLIERMGGQTARLGALANFPAPRRLDLSPHIGTIYSDMKQAAIQAGIQAGLNATDVARAMFRNGMDKSFHRLNRLARTETVSAYWKNAWDSIADLPELVMVWGSEDGPRTCAWCRERDGMVMESSQLRDHPNGRCTPIPTLRSMVEYKGSVDAGGRIYQDPEWGKDSSLPESLGPGSYREASYDDDSLPSMFTDEWGDDIENEAASYYGGDGYKVINKGLREKGKVPKDVRGLADELRSIIRRGQTSENLIVHRGMGEPGLARIFGLERDWTKGGDFPFETLVGKAFTEKGFLSTWAPGEGLNTQSSFIDNAAVMWDISLPAGTRGSKLGGLAGENEFLIPPGANLVIHNVAKSGNKTIIKAVLTNGSDL